MKPSNTVDGFPANLLGVVVYPVIYSTGVAKPSLICNGCFGRSIKFDVPQETSGKLVGKLQCSIHWFVGNYMF